MGRGLIAAIAAVAAWSAAVAPACADTVVEAESLTPVAGSPAPQPDSAASGGAVLALYGNGSASGSFTVTAPAVHLSLVGRGTSCDGAPLVQVRVDGAPVLTAAVGSGGLAEDGRDLHVAPGTHTLELVYANDYRREATLLKAGCDRSVFLDRVTLFDRPFAADSFAATPLAADAPIDPASSAFVGELERLVAANPVDTSTGDYGVPVYTVTANQPRVRVIVDRPQYDPAGHGLEDAMSAVPLPGWAQPSAGTDHTLVVWQPSTGRMWEMWGLRKDVFRRWHIRWGGYADDVRRFPGHFGGPWPQTSWGASASGIELLAGLQRIAELGAGTIDHPVSVHLPALDTSGWRWPAQRTDPVSKLPGTIQEGMRFRLPAGLDVDALGLSPYARIVARAVQRYGMIVTDHSDHCVCFVAENPDQTGGDPYRGASGIFGGDRPDFTNFPWGALELVAAPGA